MDLAVAQTLFFLAILLLVHGRRTYHDSNGHTGIIVLSLIYSSIAFLMMLAGISWGLFTFNAGEFGVLTVAAKSIFRLGLFSGIFILICTFLAFWAIKKFADWLIIKV